MKTTVVRKRPRSNKAAFKGAIYTRKELIGKRVIVMTVEEYNKKFVKLSKVKEGYEIVIWSLKTSIRNCLRGI